MELYVNIEGKIGIFDLKDAEDFDSSHVTEKIMPNYKKEKLGKNFCCYEKSLFLPLLS